MPAANMMGSIPHLFRSYKVRKHETVDCKIWEAARATSATPAFFERIVISEPGGSQEFVDGGMGCNNPIAQVLSEAELAFPGQHVACVISIGAGQPELIAIPTPGRLQLSPDVVAATQAIATDCERVAQEVAQRFRDIDNFYFRFNVQQGMQSVRLEQWERLGHVFTHANQYTRMTEVDKRLDTAAAAVRERQQTIPTAQIGMGAT
jgi:predicted acylesterase/phospholipase RssA